MAKECPECSTISYDEAAICSTCGHKYSGGVSKPTWLWLSLAAVVAFAAIAYFLR